MFFFLQYKMMKYRTGYRSYGIVHCRNSIPLSEPNNCLYFQNNLKYGILKAI